MSVGKTFTIPTIFIAIDKISAVVAGIGKNVNAFAAKAEIGLARAERGFRKLISPITSVNRLLRGMGIYIGGYLLVRTIGALISIFSNFEQANADLAAVMGVTVKQNKYLSDDAKRLGISTAKTATEVVGLQIELAKLGYQGTQIVAMTEAIINGSIAMDAPLDRVALLAGAMIRTFDKFTALDTPRIMNQMSLSTLDTALNFQKLETGLPIVAGAANAVGISFTRTLALLGKLSDAGIDASSSATALRNIFIDSKRKGHTYQEVLGNIAKKADTLTPAFNKFGRRTAVAANVLIRKLQEVEAEVIRLDSVSQNFAKNVAIDRLNTFKGSVLLLRSAFQGLVLSIEDGTGPYSHFLKTVNQVARVLLLQATGTKESRVQYALLDTRIKLLADDVKFWLNILKYVAITLVASKAILLAWGGALALFRTAVIGITAAQWAWNLSMWANPIFQITAAITAAVVSIGLMIAYWDKWGAAMSLTYGPLGIVISLVQSLRRNWDLITTAFSSDGFLSGIKKIGATLLDALIQPLQQVFKLIYQLTGADWANKLVKEYDVIRAGLGVSVVPGGESGQGVVQAKDVDSERHKIISSKTETTQRQKVSIDINDNSGKASLSGNNPDGQLVPISITSTYSPWGNK